ncbi:pikE [Symbiodinium microadriaticum]|nr:pikE [Symbiodinium microadriaticum]
MQLISLMDGLLKKVNLDLGLLTYGILATGPTDGVMEFVRGSMPISAVLSSYGNSILTYLKHHNPDSKGPLGMKAEAMDMFVRSCASSCVVTYILGIGDRHLDNVMIRTNGQLFHIDFGFIFGRDPKPLPPPFRFTRQMADAMGGEDSEHYKRFKAYCCQAYNWLRKSANLILNLLSLMVDAGIPDLSVHQEPQAVLKKVEQKFRLDLTGKE